MDFYVRKATACIDTQRDNLDWRIAWSSPWKSNLKIAGPRLSAIGQKCYVLDAALGIVG